MTNGLDCVNKTFILFNDYSTINILRYNYLAQTQIKALTSANSEINKKLNSRKSNKINYDQELFYLKFPYEMNEGVNNNYI